MYRADAAGWVEEVAGGWYLSSMTTGDWTAYNVMSEEAMHKITINVSPPTGQICLSSKSHMCLLLVSSSRTHTRCCWSLGLVGWLIKPGHIVDECE